MWSNASRWPSPYVGFTVTDQATGRVGFRADPQTGDMFCALSGRLRQIMGGEFSDNALPIDAVREGLSLTGFAALPTYSRGSAVAQYLFVNGRPVRDTAAYRRAARSLFRLPVARPSSGLPRCSWNATRNWSM